MQFIHKIFITSILILATNSTFADAQFNTNIQQFLECKKTLKDYYDLGFEFEDDLKKNGWIKSDSNLLSYTFKSKVPIEVYGMKTNEMVLTLGGMLATVKNQDTKTLAKKYGIQQSPMFQNAPYFSGEKIVKTDQANAKAEKSFRKMTLAESNPLAEDGDHKTYIGCVYISEFEQKEQEAKMKAWLE